MIPSGKLFSIHDYTEVLLRRVWFWALPFVVVVTASFLYAFFSPKEYRATTLILVTPQKVPEKFIEPTVTSRIEDRLQSIAQEIMSRTRLEMIIAEFRLYAAEAKSSHKEEIVELMRRNIQVEIRGKEGYFTISYTGHDPRIVTLVTNKLASLFIEENLKLREQQAQGTSEFLAMELKATQAKLEEQEKAITKFKKEHLGELPEQKEVNLRVLDQLQMHFQRVGDSLKSAQDRRWLIQKQLSDFEILARAATAPVPAAEEAVRPPAPPALPPVSSPEKNAYQTQRNQMRHQLEELQARYTESHPDILITRKKLSDLEARLARFEEEKTAGAAAAPPAGQESGAAVSRSKPPAGIDFRILPRYKEIETQLLGAEREIERLKEEEAKVKAQIAQYRLRVENMPAREQSMALLMRDYQNTHDAYQSLLRKWQGAQQAENLERRQKGEQFKVIDPARLPEKPFRPDIPKTLALGFLLGVVSGIGGAFLREQMDHSFRDAGDLEATLGLKVLANIPKIETKTV